MSGQGRTRLAVACVAAVVIGCGASGVAAGSWQGLTIGQPGPGQDRAFADAFHATGALSRGGGRDVLMMRDVAPGAVLAAVANWPSDTGAIVYVSGALDADSLRLKGGSLPLSDLLAGFAARGVADLALLVENCAGRDGAPQEFSLPVAPAGMRLLVAATAGPEGECPQGPARLTDRLTGASGDMSLQAALSDLVLRDAVTAPIPVAEVAAASASPVVSVAAALSPVVSRDVVSIAPVVSPVGGGTTVSPVSPVQAVSRPQGGGNDAVLIFAAPAAAAQRAVLPRAAGLPEPSIIVGLVEGATPASFERATEAEEVGTNEIGYDNLAARRGLQAQDPALYASLVEAGAFDPPAALIPRALQEELARMGCYTAGIDGVWGNGSRNAVQRYFAERAGVDPVTLEPEARLFRQILLEDTVTCRAPQVTTTTRAPAPASTPRAAPQTQTTRPRATTTQAAPPRQQPTPQTGTRRIQSGTALGVFR